MIDAKGILGQVDELSERYGEIEQEKTKLLSDLENYKSELIEQVAIVNGMIQELTPRVGRRSGKGSVANRVKEIVEVLPGDAFITQSAVTVDYKNRWPDDTPRSLVSLVSHTLRQLSIGEERMLDLVEKGLGSSPAKYRKVSASRREGETG